MTCQRILRFTILAVLSFALNLHAADDGTKKSFDILAGPAGKTLKQFSEQSGVGVIFVSEAVRGVETNSVKGELTNREALDQMLHNTPLIVTQDEKTGAFSIRRDAPDKESDVTSAGQGPLATVPATAVANTGNDQVPIQLDPFQVSSDKDVGYLANSTLSGTLFSTDLKDTASSIEVFTSQLIQDVGAINIKDLMVYGNNTVSDLDEGTAGGANGNYLSFNYSQFRVRGQDISQSEDYFIYDNLPIDMYNIDRVEESRGPNSVLFGIGSPSGVLNYSTKRAVIGRTFGDLTLTTGSFDTLRATLDVNESLLNNKLAVRVNVAFDHEGSYRLYTDADSKLGNAAVTYRVTPKIELRGAVEVGSRVDEGARNDPLLDNGALEFAALGRPIYPPNSPVAATVDPQNWSYQGIPGSYANGSNTVTFIQHPGQSNSVGQIINEAGQLSSYSAQANVDILAVNPSLGNPRINTLGPDAKRHATWESDSVFADVQLLPRVFMQASFNHLQDNFVTWNNPNDSYLSADANELLPNGQPNPDAGKFYLSGAGQTYNFTNVFDRGRLLFSGEQDFGKWFGHYHAAVSLQQDDDGSYNPAFNEVWAGNPFGGAPEYDTVQRRTYVQEGVWNTYYMNISGSNGGFIKNAVDPATGQSFSSTLVPYNISSYRSTQRDIMGIVQAQYLDDLLAVNFGARRDTFSEFTRGTVRNADTQILEEDAAAGFASSQAGNTTSVGAVLHVVKTKFVDFDVLADKSDNFSLAQSGLYELTDKTSGPTTQAMPGATGTGNEWGFAITLLDGMFYLKAVHFADATLNLYNYIGAYQVGPKNDTILQALVTQGSISQATADARSDSLANVAPYDQTDDGNEISLTANVTKNWRLQVNFSENNPNESDDEAADIAFWNGVLKPYYAQFPENIRNNADPYDPNATIAQEIATTDVQLAQDTSTEGKGLIGFRKYKWNFFTRYTFDKTILKGVFVGGGYVFQSQMLIGTYPNGVLMYGGKTGTGSGLLGYNTTVWSHPVRFQLNILNLFDNTAPIVYRRAIDNNYLYPGLTDYLLPQHEEFPDPRTWRLTADFSF